MLKQISFLPLSLLIASLASCASAGQGASIAEQPAQEDFDEAEKEEIFAPFEILLPEEPSAFDENDLETQEEEASAEVLEDGNEIVAIVDSVVITRQDFRQTKSEVEAVVEDLNQITKERDYSRWLDYLDPAYRRTLSDRNYLEQISNSLPQALRDRRVRLTTLKDYFDYVFVPSRQNIRVDDIQFITPSRVYVIMDLSRDQRAAVYILERGSGGNWKLVDRN